MVSKERWKSAQDYELGYWQGAATRVAEGKGSLGWYRWRAGELRKRLERLDLGQLAEGGAKVLEVGGGPIGVCTFFPGQERMAVDPLADAYAENPQLVELRDPEVEYRQGVGESLPCPDSSYDLVIIENCIDHVQDVEGVMAELKRVLKPGGVLYLTVNNRSAYGYYVHRILSRLQIDRGHPHTFTPRRTVELISESGFRPLNVEIGSYRQARREDLASGDRRARLKALLGVSEYVVSVVAVREPEKQASDGDWCRRIVADALKRAERAEALE